MINYPHIRRPDEILAYRSLSRILGARPRTLWAVGPADSTLTALQVMGDKKTAFLVVLDQGRMVGVVSERDPDDAPWHEAQVTFMREHRPHSLIQRLIEPEEIANMVAYLCSEYASATTGGALRVDGGYVDYIVP